MSILDDMAAKVLIADRERAKGAMEIIESLLVSARGILAQAAEEAVLARLYAEARALLEMRECIEFEDPEDRTARLR